MPGGRPTKLDQVVRYNTTTGTPVTAGEAVVERRKLGLPDQEAADSAGISRATLHKWRLGGARARTEALRGKRLTKTERALAEFVDALERAEAEAEANRLAIINRAASGGAVVTKTTEKVKVNPDGTTTVLERTIVTETLRPEWTAAAWWLERRKPARYARRVEVTGPEGAPLVPQDEQAANIAAELRAFQAGIATAQEAAADRE